MLTLDDREQSMFEEVRRASRDVEVNVMHLDCGDARFGGNGEDHLGRPQLVDVGIERKHLEDLIACMKDRRLSGLQLRRMYQAYEYVFLFVEDVWRPGPGGCIEKRINRRRGGKSATSWEPLYARGNGGRGRSSISYRQVDSYLSSLELRGRVVVRRTANAAETAVQYVDLYKWFNDKTWAEHKSHDQIYAPAPDTPRGKRADMQFAHRGVTRLEMIAAQLPHIDRRARQVAEHFGTVKRMVNATEADWTQIEGVGRKTAWDIMQALHEKGRVVV